MTKEELYEHAIAIGGVNTLLANPASKTVPRSIAGEMAARALALHHAATEQQEHLDELVKQMRALQDEVPKLRQQKDGAYAERNKLVAFLAHMALSLGWKAGVGQHPEEDTSWERDWRTIVFIDLPTGQVSWHFHDSEEALLLGLPAYEGAWDGHSNPEKWSRVLDAMDATGVVAGGGK